MLVVKSAKQTSFFEVVKAWELVAMVTFGTHGVYPDKDS